MLGRANTATAGNRINRGTPPNLSFQHSQLAVIAFTYVRFARLQLRI